MEVGEDAHGRQAHELVERPRRRALNQTARLELPRLKVNARRAVRVEHGPLARARLAGRQTPLAARVGADDDLAALELLRPPRLALLPEGVFDQSV